MNTATIANIEELSLEIKEIISKQNYSGKRLKLHANFKGIIKKLSDSQNIISIGYFDIHGKEQEILIHLHNNLTAQMFGKSCEWDDVPKILQDEIEKIP